MVIMIMRAIQKEDDIEADTITLVKVELTQRVGVFRQPARRKGPQRGGSAGVEAWLVDEAERRHRG